MKDAVLPSEARLVTAYHEAGHVVMAHLCGQIVTGAEIIGDDEHAGTVSSLRYLGEPRWGVDRNIPTAQIEARILCLVAGVAAENILTGATSWREPEDDVNEAVRLALRVVSTCDRVLPLLEEARDHAADLLECHWVDVEALAVQLLRHGRLDRDQIREVLGDDEAGDSAGSRHNAA